MQADLAPLLGNEYDVYQPKSYKNMAACIHFLVKFLKKPNFLIGCQEFRQNDQKKMHLFIKKIFLLVRIEGGVAER